MSGYPVPYVTQRTGQGERTLDVYSRLLATGSSTSAPRSTTASRTPSSRSLLHLANTSPESPISLYLNSPGGSIPATLAIYDAMQYVAPAVETTCVGQAAATATLLLAGGEPGRRQILRTAGWSSTRPARRGAAPSPT